MWWFYVLTTRSKEYIPMYRFNLCVTQFALSGVVIVRVPSYSKTIKDPAQTLKVYIQFEVPDLLRMKNIYKLNILLVLGAVVIVH